MKRTLLFFFITALGFTLSFSQENNKEKSITTGNIDEKFDYVITKSNNYQEYKVIKKDWLYRLKKQVLDSVNKQKAENKNLINTIASQTQKINELEIKANELNATIEQINTDKEHINFIGFDFKKVDFKNLFWSIFGILTVLLALFIYKYNNSNTVTKTTKEQLSDLEKEFEEHRKTALEREQKVMRKLQDELNKNKTNS